MPIEQKLLAHEKPSLKELALVFGRIGATAFGGPAAHLAMIDEEIVRRRKWISQEEFLDLLGAINLIPGPNSTEMAIHIGYKTRGWKGLLVAGTSFIAPAFLIVWAIAVFYVKFGSLPELQSVFLGVKPVILAIIAQAVWSLSRTAIKDWILGFCAALALILYLMSGQEILVLFLVAILNLVLRIKPKPPGKSLLFSFLILQVSPLTRAWAQLTQQSKVAAAHLFWYFAKVGSVLFGSGYVLIAFLQNDLVEKYHWITQQQLIDAITVGQLTPGPVFTTATFIGYLISGHEGALFATVGIFAPAFLFVALSAPFIPVLRKSKWTATLLDGLNVASLSLMAGAALILAKDTVSNLYGGVIFLLSLALLVKFKINSTWLILIAAGLGFVFHSS